MKGDSKHLVKATEECRQMALDEKRNFTHVEILSTDTA